MIRAALPEPPAVARDVSYHLVLVRKIHLPDERAISEHPHVSSPVTLCFADWGRGRGRATAALGAARALHILSSLC